MKDVYVEEYTVRYQSLALLPHADMVYQAKVVELDRTVFVAQPCMKIIEESCLNGGASFNGRRDAVLFHTGFQKRVPVPLSISHQICAFPTHSPHIHDCAWIFTQHIKKVSDIEEKGNKAKKKAHARVHFTSGQHLDINASKHVLDKQMTRASHCMNLFTKL
ncbi:competence protein ComK [Alteribacter aurantiacus]|uniref:competence protein ComK n=1 Tax=Alteribacter aurantiacus TaxID=254410 RepID=UPI0003F4CD23|nr:competence protein ComK [Alteribacter aurantiacus]